MCDRLNEIISPSFWHTEKAGSKQKLCTQPSVEQIRRLVSSPIVFAVGSKSIFYCNSLFRTIFLMNIDCDRNVSMLD